MNARLRTPYKYPQLVLAASGVAGAFDSEAVDCPFLFTHDGQFHMTFVGFDGRGYQTGLARSSDLLHWEKLGVIFGRREDVPILRQNVSLPSILRENDLFGNGALRQIDGRYWGAYHAYPEAGYEVGAGVIGICSSTDLLHWDVRPPILRADDAGAGRWERGGLYKPYLMEQGGRFYIFYNAKDGTEWPWMEQTGVASSADLVHWERHPGNPLLPTGPAGSFDDRFASDPCVLRLSESGKGDWAMFYFGLSSDGHARESVAFSDDLFTWTKSNEILIDVAPRSSVDALDSKYAHKPGMMWHAGRLYHFYCAVADVPGAGERRGIAVAMSEAV